MTYILVGALAAAIGLASVLAVALVWLVRKVAKLGELRLIDLGAVGDAKAEAVRWEAHVDKLELALNGQSDRVVAELAARKKVEDQRDRAIKRLLKSGDPADVAAAIRIDLGRLSDLSEVSDLPPGTIATPPGGDED